MKWTNIMAGTIFGVGAAVFIGIFLAILAAGGIAFLVIRSKVKKVSKTLFGTSNMKQIANEIQKQDWEYEEEPKSVSGMTNLLEPQIKRSYADFQWMDFKKQVEKTLLNALKAWYTGDISVIENVTPRMREELLAWIQKEADNGVQLHMDNIHIHRTEIGNFKHDKGKDIIFTQTALEYFCYRTKGGSVVDGVKEKKQQTRFDMEFIFVFDSNAKEFTDLEITQCPNCGAPVTKVGMICEYCGTPVNPKSEKRWVLNHMKQVM